MVVLLATLLQSIAALFPDTPLGWFLLGLATLAVLGCGVLVVRDARATWQEQSRRVTHL